MSFKFGDNNNNNRRNNIIEIDSSSSSSDSETDLFDSGNESEDILDGPISNTFNFDMYIDDYLDC